MFPRVVDNSYISDDYYNYALPFGDELQVGHLLRLNLRD